MEKGKGEVMKANTVTIWVCIDCMFSHANGETSSDEAPDCEPWCLIDKGDEVAMGIMADEHADSCTPEDREEGCDCATDSFSWSPCEGCGSSLGGERHAFTLWFD